MDIVVGEARIYYVNNERQKGWVAHGGYLITNRKDAVEYARKTNFLIQRGQ